MTDKVPVPVRSDLRSPCWRTCRMKSRYCRIWKHRWTDSRELQGDRGVASPSGAARCRRAPIRKDRQGSLVPATSGGGAQGAFCRAPVSRLAMTAVPTPTPPDRGNATMHSGNQFDLLRERRFAPFFWTQFLGAGNDYVYKNALIIFVAFHAARLTTLDPNALVN